MILSILFFLLGISLLLKYRKTREILCLYIALTYFVFALVVGLISHYIFT